MNVELLGHVGLAGALLASTFAALAAFAAARFRSNAWLRASRAGVAGLAGLFTIASVALLLAFLNDEFKFAYVARHSERAMAFGYKVAAFWAGQEGSLLLWAWMIAVLSIVAVLARNRRRGVEEGAFIGSLALCNAFFAALMLFAANPFELLPGGVVPADGRSMNPLLQNPAMIIHPPILFMGYAGFTVPFAIMIGALVAGRTDNHWVRDIRRWLLAAWLFLSAGILIGAWWAYIELGWGGYWAWDPVENASLLPWLTATALLHSIVIQEHRGMFKKWNVSLISASFILCIFATYLTRSGIIQSVHAFPESRIAQFFLSFLVGLVLVSIGLGVWRRHLLKPERHIEGFFGREGFFLLTNIVLVIMMLTTLIGTIFPLISSVFTSNTITLNQSFYNKFVAPMGVVLVALMAFGPILTYGKSAPHRFMRGMVAPAVIAFAGTTVMFAIGVREPWTVLCTFLLIITFASVFITIGHSVRADVQHTNDNVLVAFIRVFDGNHRRYGGQMAHLGVALMVIGIVGSSLYETKMDLSLAPGETAQVGSYTLRYDVLRDERMSNYSAVIADVALIDGSGRETILRPERRFYDKSERGADGAPQSYGEVALKSNWQTDLYVILGGWEAGGAHVGFQVLIKPVTIWIWIGGIVLGIGCLFSLLPSVWHRTQQAEVKSDLLATSPPRPGAVPPSPVPPGVAARNGTEQPTGPSTVEQFEAAPENEVTADTWEHVGVT